MEHHPRHELAVVGAHKNGEEPQTYKSTNRTKKQKQLPKQTDNVLIALIHHRYLDLVDIGTLADGQIRYIPTQLYEC